MGWGFRKVKKCQKQQFINNMIKNNNNNNNNNRPDIRVKNQREKSCILIDMAVPTDRNVTPKEAEKKLKYSSLCIELEGVWSMKCVAVSVIIGVTGKVTKGLKINVEAIPGKHSVYSSQQTAVLGTAHIKRKVLQCEA
jgi:hypothetical protein